MKKEFNFTGKRLIPIGVLIFGVVTLALFAMLNLNTYIIKYENSIDIIKSMNDLTEEEVLEQSTLFFNENIEIDSEIIDGDLTVFVNDLYPVNIEISGSVYEIYTDENTVSGVLEEAGIEIDNNDIINMQMDTLVGVGTTIDIIEVEKTTTNETMQVYFETKNVETMSLEYGESEVVTEGQHGEKILTYEQIYYDGKLVSNVLVEEKMTIEPVSQVIEHGTFNPNIGVVIEDGVITTSYGTLEYEKVIDVSATAYTTELQYNKITATGSTARVGAIAVDPRVIPLGSKLYITSADGTSWIYGVATAEDVGGGIKGNKIDLFFNTHRECILFGVKQAKVYVLK